MGLLMHALRLDLPGISHAPTSLWEGAAPSEPAPPGVVATEARMELRRMGTPAGLVPSKSTISGKIRKSSREAAKSFL